MSRTQMFRVMCPYCTVGSTLVAVQKMAGAHKVDTAPRQCSNPGCARYFKLRIRMHIEGQPIEPVDRQSAIRNALKEIV